MDNLRQDTIGRNNTTPYCQGPRDPMSSSLAMCLLIPIHYEHQKYCGLEPRRVSSTNCSVCHARILDSGLIGCSNTGHAKIT